MTREEAIRTIRASAAWTGEEREALGTLVPELAEPDDKMTIGSLKAYLNGTWKVTGPVRDMFVKETLEWLDGLEERLEGPGEAPAAGWAGEDDKMMDWCESVVRGFEIDHCGDDKTHSGFLRSLRDRALWRPSGDQLTALSIAVSDADPSGEWYGGLVSLLGDLSDLAGNDTEALMSTLRAVTLLKPR